MSVRKNNPYGYLDTMDLAEQKIRASRESVMRETEYVINYLLRPQGEYIADNSSNKLDSTQTHLKNDD